MEFFNTELKKKRVVDVEFMINKHIFYIHIFKAIMEPNVQIPTITIIIFSIIILN